MPKVIRTSSDLVVFISSTYVDLKAFRDKIEESLSRVESSFRSMKFFGSKEGDPLELCLQKLRQCNYYVAAIGHRYGSIPEGYTQSYTELEYEEAKKLNIKRRIYSIDEQAPVQADLVEADENRLLLERFKRKLRKENSVVVFSSPEDLSLKIISDILLGLAEKPEILSFANEKYLPAIRRKCASISFLGLDIRAMKRHGDVNLERVFVHSKFSPLGASARRSSLGRSLRHYASDDMEEEHTGKALSML